MALAPSRGVLPVAALVAKEDPLRERVGFKPRVLHHHQVLSRQIAGQSLKLRRDRRPAKNITPEVLPENPKLETTIAVVVGQRLDPLEHLLPANM